jgi:hypothetical protein
MAFGANQVLVQGISEAKLRAFYIGFDLGACRTEAFSEVLMDAIVDFAFGYHTGILEKYDRQKLKEAAKSLYRINSFNDVKWTYVDSDAVLDEDDEKAKDNACRRGEFGELILHVLLRDYLNTTPLLSKIYFKDADGVTVHGFDAVHIGPDLPDCNAASLYLGESKIYYRQRGNAGEHGIKELLGDIKSHFRCDFLKRESALIAKKERSFLVVEEYEDDDTKARYESFLKQKKYWFDVFDGVSKGTHKMEAFLKSVTIPLVCTYQSEIFSKCATDSHPDFQTEYEAEMRKLETKFNDLIGEIENEVGEPVKTDLNILLILFPIPSKKELIKVLHQKLYHQQNA